MNKVLLIGVVFGLALVAASAREVHVNNYTDQNAVLVGLNGAAFVRSVSLRPGETQVLNWPEEVTAFQGFTGTYIHTGLDTAVFTQNVEGNVTVTPDSTPIRATVRWTGVAGPSLLVAVIPTMNQYPATHAEAHQIALLLLLVIVAAIGLGKQFNDGSS